jgi:hypothetical protein
MTIMQSCDHHGPDLSIPDNRSRKRMLEQLRAATEMSDRLAELFHHGRVSDRSARLEGWPANVPLVAVELQRTVPLMQAWLAWLAVSPSGDDWAPPYEPPSEIRVPPEGEPGVEASEGVSSEPGVGPTGLGG